MLIFFFTGPNILICLPSETYEREYKGRLEKKYESPTFSVVSEVFKGLSGKKIIAASSSYER